MIPDAPDTPMHMIPLITDASHTYAIDQMNPPTHREFRLFLAQRNGYAGQKSVRPHPPEPVMCNHLREFPTVFVRSTKEPLYGSIYKAAPSAPWAE